MTQPWAERRREARHDASGEIRIQVRLPKLLEIHARLVDISPSGFRAMHMYPALSAGQKVQFCFEENEGLALVVWNRIFEEHVETGFFILQE
jgi:hypothetical protein